MPKKVFELANEIGIGAIDLVDKLNSIGFSVKNHMVTLQDEDIAKVMEALAPAEKKVTKKKVVKKKVTKKTVVKKVTKATTEESVTEDVVPSVTEEVKIDVIVEDETEIKVKSKLEIVKSNVEEKPAEEKPAVVRTKTVLKKSSDKEVKKADDDVDVFKEKMHSFTPVSMPEPPKPTIKKPEAAKTQSGTTTSTTATSTAPKFATQKKRIGDLAAIVSKKGSGDKAKDMTQIRADEGLKLASTVMGRSLYTPMKRKKIYTGSDRKKTVLTDVKGAKRVVAIFGTVTANDLAQKLSEKFESLQNKCLDLNLLVKKEDYIGLKLAKLIGELYDYRVEDKAFDEEKVIGNNLDVDKSALPLRNPIITVMGHVDHGKTTLLDHIRSTKVTSGEAGGITQHIGAYSVNVGKATLTFLDTPGHAAFASMRQRGADATDIVILVVAADDGVMPQTKESIKYAKKAGSPIIVAINKMDKEGANPDRVKQELTEFELVSEEWGGDTMFCEVSALNGDGIDALLESVKIQAEIMDLREDSKGQAEGLVIEAKIESGRGPVATVLVQKGTLKKGDAIVCGECYGRARTLMDDSGKIVTSAGPSIPVQILGMSTVPSPGEVANVVKNEREAKKIVENRIAERRKLEGIEAPKVASLEDFFADIDVQTGEKQILKLVVRTDVQGSFEAIKQSVEAIGNDEVGVEILSGGAGAITDNDVNMAANAEGYIIGFNMRPVTSARKLSEEKGIEIRTYSIIYELIDDVTQALEGMLDPERVEKYIGRAEVKDTFSIPKIGTIAGCSVIDGKIERGCNIRLLRSGKIMFDGKLSTLKRFKDEVKEVKNGYECGMALEGYDNIRNDDIIEAYLLEEKARKLEPTII
jgi:translation initiation factor IF-2